MAVPFSCKTRVCPSCVNRRAECLCHSLAEKLPEGDYRHLVVTLPKKMGLRKRFPARHSSAPADRPARARMASPIRCHRSRRDEKEQARPGIIMAVQSFGAGLKSHLFGAFVAPDSAEVRRDSEFLDDVCQVPHDWGEWDAA